MPLKFKLINFRYKEVVAEALIKYFEPIRIKIEDYQKDEKFLNDILTRGNDKARCEAVKTLNEVKEKVGLGV